MFLVFGLDIVHERSALWRHIGLHDPVQLFGGDCRRGMLEGGVKGGEVHLITILISSEEQHGLEPVAPENLVGQIRCSGLELGVARLVGPLQHHHQLKLLLGKLDSSQFIERRLFINDMNNLQRPHKEDTTLIILVWTDLQRLHLLQNLSFKTYLSFQQLQ